MPATTSRSRSADTSDAEIQRATQKIADALEDMIATAPDQWYSFKPVWPQTRAEKVALEARAVTLTGAAA